MMAEKNPPSLVRKNGNSVHCILHSPLITVSQACPLSSIRIHHGAFEMQDFHAQPKYMAEASRKKPPTTKRRVTSPAAAEHSKKRFPSAYSVCNHTRPADAVPQPRSSNFPVHRSSGQVKQHQTDRHQPGQIFHQLSLTWLQPLAGHYCYNV